MSGKILIECDLLVCTGMHIGGSSAFSAIGAVDSPVIRDPRTGWPIVPGSSLKGKLRTLLARSLCNQGNLPQCSNDNSILLRMFGATQPVRFSRLQFADAFLSNYQELEPVGLTEIKSENTINRVTSQAMPRQIERVVAGSVFKVNIVYNIQNSAEAAEDLKMLAKGMKLLELDYLGGHGSRGSGRVSLRNFRLSTYETDFDVTELQDIFRKEVQEYEIFSAPVGV